MRRAWVALCLIAWLRGSALAGPSDPAGAHSDPDVADRAPATSPWIDLASPDTLQRITASSASEDHDHRLASGLALGGIYAGFAGWAYLAWYRGHKPRCTGQDAATCSEFKVGGDGWLGKDTYAGGADKFGHAWATMVLARGGTAILDAGGWDHTRSTIVATALSEALFFGVEVKDGFYYEFSLSDLTGDTLGALAALAFELSPRLDELFDYRVEYWPSDVYLGNLDGSRPCAAMGMGPSCSRWNVAEDYSGETYLLALHLGGIHALRDMKYGTWSRFVDLAVGFETRNYKPPPSDPTVERHQHLFLGVSLNAQGLFDYLLDRHPTARKVTHGMFEVFNVPFTAVPLTGVESTTNMVMSGGA